ncbi:MAG: 3-isopropylmalate dehydratase small subunit [Spirochaetes bacterium GWF1_51_8]|nr:MAG: 3-isopropylmalate dehydratase small subunit [Spirochaetes bacterium GWF1_51_8]
MNYKGKTWKYGDNIDTDKIIPARYLNTSDPVELAKHCLEDEDTTFAGKVGKGDILIAGENFGSGSSREHAPIAIKACGVSLVIAKSFARIFFRNSINIALPVIEDARIVNETETGDIIEADFDKGYVKNITKNKEYKIHPLPEMMKNIMSKGGLMEYAKDFINL